MQAIRQFRSAIATDILRDGLTEHRFTDLPLKQEGADGGNDDKADDPKCDEAKFHSQAFMLRESDASHSGRKSASANFVSMFS